MKYGLAILLAGLLVGAALVACRVEVGHAGDGERPDPAEAAPRAADEGSDGRWDYLLATPRRSGTREAWDGRRDGPATEWYESGRKREEGTYRNDLRQGLWTFWYPSGQKRWEGTYRNGEPEGEERAWYENGEKRYEGRYSAGRRTGTFTEWHDNGQKASEGTYRDGLRQGMFRFWNRDGSIDEARTGFYLRGAKVPD